MLTSSVWRKHLKHSDPSFRWVCPTYREVFDWFARKGVDVPEFEADNDWDWCAKADQFIIDNMEKLKH